jgi:hypothetical protein
MTTRRQFYDGSMTRSSAFGAADVGYPIDPVLPEEALAMGSSAII